MQSRRDELLWLLDVVRESIMLAPPEKRAALVMQMRGLLAELGEMGENGDEQDSRLIDFQQALAARRDAAAAGARHT